MSKTCNRCKQSPPCAGDTYCLACSVWEAIGRELQAPWQGSVLRSVVTDILVAGGRQIRALRNVAGSPSGGEASSSSKQKVEAGTPCDRPAIPRRRGEDNKKRGSEGLHPKASAKRSRLSSEELESDIEEDPEEEVPEAFHQPLGKDSHRKPPEPDEPPPHLRGRSDQKRSFEAHPWRQEKNRHRTEEKQKDSHRRSRRGGRKHQRVEKVRSDPFALIHRPLPSGFLDVRAEDLGREAFEHL